MIDIESAAMRVVAAYQAAVLAKDAGALIALYDPKVRVFDTWGVWCHDGAPAWQTTIEAWFTSLGNERVKVGFDEVRISGGSELALLSAFVGYTGLSAGGETLRTLHNRITWGLKMRGHVLRIVHEHTSAPIGFEDMKAMLQRRA